MLRQRTLTMAGSMNAGIDPIKIRVSQVSLTAPTRDFGRELNRDQKGAMALL